MNSRDGVTKKITCYLVIVVLLLSPIASTHGIGVKTQGRLALVAILGGIAILTKYLIERDGRTVEAFHTRLGPPMRVIEFERGFDRWRIEWYGNRRYVFRNNVLQKETDTKPVEPYKSF